MALFGKSSVGLEIDSFEARFVELSGTPASSRVVKYGKVSVPEGAVKEGIIVDPEGVAGALSELWARDRIKTRDVVIGVSNQDVLVRFATFPKVPKDKLDNLIRFQAQDFLPMPVNTVIIDYMVIDEAAGIDGNSIEVLLVAARKTMVEGFLKCFEKAGLKAKDMDVTSLVLWRLIPDNEINHAVAIVNLGIEAGNILLMAKGAPRLARHLPISLKNFLETSRMRNIRASDLNRLLTTISEEELEEFGGGFADVLLSSINYYYVQSNAEAIGKIILCGYGSGMEGLVDNLKQTIDIPIELSRTFEKFASAGNKIHFDSKTESEYAVGMSLALRGLGG